ncbi:hypothetical protein [Thermoactinospora rubra]|uniref:hypothetical protein n=1 Tax=Thermoactinospora rubra TaxID=1088767 RepID=UPI000A101FA6|nr:hypothetical protein [Thermoactinospora rubra]
MRLVSRILIGATAATMVAVAAPGAATAAPASTQTPPAHFHEADWGPYFSTNYKSKAFGHVTVDKQTVKVKVFKKKWKKVLACKKKDGKLVCKKVWRLVKVPVWIDKTVYPFKVDSTLANYKWWGKRQPCAWETFKVVGFDGKTSYTSFRNCSKHPKHFSFTGKDAAHIFVNVSRGDFHKPRSHFSGWKDVYHAAA